MQVSDTISRLDVLRALEHRHDAHQITETLFRDSSIAAVAAAAIVWHLACHYLFLTSDQTADFPLYVVLTYGGIPLVYRIARQIMNREVGSDVLAGLSIVTAAFLSQYLAGALVVLMLSGGKSIEDYSRGRASQVLSSLAKRTPLIAHRIDGNSIKDIPVDEVRPDDRLIMFPGDLCPVDGVVTEGHGIMDESYLTGEPYMISKTPGTRVLSGAVNGGQALKIKSTALAADSRFARIMEVIRKAEDDRPRIRRLADTLGAVFAPIAVSLALLAWLVSGQALRFLAVLVIATPCPLLIGIPVAIIGAISLAAKRGIVIKSPALLEQVDGCTTLILDKTGTLTRGKPYLTDVVAFSGFSSYQLIRLAASLERYSKHPLSAPILDAAKERGLGLIEAAEISEQPGSGLRGKLNGYTVSVTGRKQVPSGVELPHFSTGLECVVLVNGAPGGLFRFHDRPKADAKPFIQHLSQQHGINRIMLVSGDRASEVRHVAAELGIEEVHAGKTPEEKAAIAKEQTARAPTIFVGDGVNDAPGLLNSTVGIAMGPNSDITSEAAGAVVMDNSLNRLDELFHIARRMRRIGLQSAVGGMALSAAGMIIAAFGFLPPIQGAIAQELIDLAAVANALRVSVPFRKLADF